MKRCAHVKTSTHQQISSWFAHHASLSLSAYFSMLPQQLMQLMSSSCTCCPCLRIRNMAAASLSLSQ
jgi:hypothetical protein